MKEIAKRVLCKLRVDVQLVINVKKIRKNPWHQMQGAFCEVYLLCRPLKYQPLFNEIYYMFRDLAFTYKGSAEQHKRKTDGRIVEADAIFERLN